MPLDFRTKPPSVTQVSRPQATRVWDALAPVRKKAVIYCVLFSGDARKADARSQNRGRDRWLNTQGTRIYFQSRSEPGTDERADGPRAA